MFWFFGPEACGILAPWPGIELAPPALEGKVLTTGSPGKSLLFFLKIVLAIQGPLMSCFFFSSFFVNSFIGIYFTYHIIHP